MIHLIAFLAIGVLFVVILLVWALRMNSPSVGNRTGPELSLTGELRHSPRLLADRIFAEQDWDFVMRQTPPEIHQAFLAERTRLALYWLRQTRKQAAELMEFHRRAARANIQLELGAEMKLAAKYLTFLVLYRILLVLIRLSGPFHTRKMAGYATGVAEQLWALCGQLLAGADPVLRSRVNAAWTDKSS